MTVTLHAVQPDPTTGAAACGSRALSFKLNGRELAIGFGCSGSAGSTTTAALTLPARVSFFAAVSLVDVADEAAVIGAGQNGSTAAMPWVLDMLRTGSVLAGRLAATMVAGPVGC